MRHSCLGVGPLLILWIVLQSVQEMRAAYKTHDLHIGAVFPISEGDWKGGVACRPAAFMALEDINKQTEILPNYRLKLANNDSRCSPGLGTKMLYELLYNYPRKIMFLTGCSTVTTFIAQAAKMWNLIVLSYGSSSPALSNRARFPTFFRTHPSASIQNPTRLRFISKMGWKKVTLVWQLEEVFTSTVKDFEIEANRWNISIFKRLPFQKNSESQVKALQNSDARIIVGLFYEKMARKVFCDAYRFNVTGPKIVWIIIGWYADDWFERDLEKDNINCTKEEMRQAVEGHLTTESLMWNEWNATTISNLTAFQFRERLLKRINEENGSKYRNTSDFVIPGFVEAPLAYDAVWALALALDVADKALKAKGNSSLANYDYQDLTIYDELYKAMNKTKFSGISTTVYFDASGNRISWTKIEQMIKGEYRTLGHYHFIHDNLSMTEQPTWPGGRIPRDSKKTLDTRSALSLSLYVFMSCLSCVGFLLALLCLVFTYRNWDHRYIRPNQPAVNCILTLGCILALSGVVLTGADRLHVTNSLWLRSWFQTLCHVKAWVLSTGFTLGYGALFCKIWLVYRQATYQKKKEGALGQATRPWEAYVVLGSLLLVDAILLGVWQHVDPMVIHTVSLAVYSDINDDDIVYQPKLDMCNSDKMNIWLGLCFGWKGLLLVFGLLLAYETRNVKLKSISSDSRFAGMAIYNVVVLCIITAPVSMIIGQQQDALFAFIAVAVCLSCGLSLGLLFLPKMMAVWRHPGDGGEAASLTDATLSTREEEERHQRLVAENDQLKNQIAECERRLQDLHRRLQTRAQVRAQLTHHQLEEVDKCAAAASAYVQDDTIITDSTNEEASPLTGNNNKMAPAGLATRRRWSRGGTTTNKRAPQLLGVPDESVILESTTSGVFSESMFTTTTRALSVVKGDEMYSETYL